MQRRKKVLLLTRGKEQFYNEKGASSGAVLGIFHRIIEVLYRMVHCEHHPWFPTESRQGFSFCLKTKSMKEIYIFYVLGNTSQNALLI